MEMTWQENFIASVSVRQKNAGAGISSNDAYNTGSVLPHENPPFIPGFFVLKVQVNETIVSKGVSVL